MKLFLLQEKLGPKTPSPLRGEGRGEGELSYISPLIREGRGGVATGTIGVLGTFLYKKCVPKTLIRQNRPLWLEVRVKEGLACDGPL